MNIKDFDFIIDVRSSEEFHMKHIPESINVSLDKIANNFNETELSKIDKNKKILLVCESGGRAALAKEILEEKGFNNLENGGPWKNWK
ncbi:MAG: rhodanese-like domain-containing protein [Candidatus Nomurabacteria bacterium]